MVVYPLPCLPRRVPARPAPPRRSHRPARPAAGRPSQRHLPAGHRGRPWGGWVRRPLRLAHRLLRPPHPGRRPHRGRPPPLPLPGPAAVLPAPEVRRPRPVPARNPRPGHPARRAATHLRRPRRPVQPATQRHRLPHQLRGAPHRHDRLILRLLRRTQRHRRPGLGHADAPGLRRRRERALPIGRLGTPGRRTPTALARRAGPRRPGRDRPPTPEPSRDRRPDDAERGHRPARRTRRSAHGDQPSVTPRTPRRPDAARRRRQPRRGGPSTTPRAPPHPQTDDHRNGPREGNATPASSSR